MQKQNLRVTHAVSSAKSPAIRMVPISPVPMYSAVKYQGTLPAMQVASYNTPIKSHSLVQNPGQKKGSLRNQISGRKQINKQKVI